MLEEAERTAALTGTQGEIELKKPGDRKAKKKGGRRKQFPPHLPVVRTTYELPEDDRKCSCGGDLHEIGQDVRRELERVEISIIHEIACKKYGCRNCTEGVRTAPGPDRVIEKGILGRGFLAQVIVERFSNHMPYYRLEKKYGAEGLDLSRSVLQRSMSKSAELLEPIANRLREEILQAQVMNTDDTPVTIAQGDAGGSQQGRVWVYLDQDQRHWYDFTKSRKRDGPLQVLGDYKGWIQADGYPGYDRLYLPGGAREVGCWAHARRKFVEAEKYHHDLATEAIDQIRELYKIEKESKNLDPEARKKVRQKYSVPILTAFRAWLELTATKVLRKGPLAKAIRYALNQWGALNAYTEDGRLAIDNNAAERALRCIAVGRKNWLFFQQDSGGKTATILLSLLMTAKAIGLNPRTYLRDVLTRISHCSDVGKLTPHGWKKHFAAEVASTRDEILHRLSNLA